MYTSKATEWTVHFSDWAQSLSETQSAPKSASPRAQFGFSPTAQNLTQEIWSSSTSEKIHTVVYDEGPLQISFRQIMHRGQKIERCTRMPLEKRLLEPGVPPKDSGPMPRSVYGWFPLVYTSAKNGRKRQKRPKSKKKTDPLKLRPEGSDR